MILELSKQVCSLQSAKRLKELGVKQDSLWYWVESEKEKTSEIVRHLDVEHYEKINYYDLKHINYYSAYTCAEIGELLPPGYVSFRRGIDTYYGGVIKMAYCEAIDEKNPLSHPEGTEIGEAECRANMLTYLLENKIIEEGK